MIFLLPIISLLVVLAFAMIITRVATMALMLTGLSHEAAQFQARSAYTGVGFTTIESESIAAHPVRRHIVMTLMLLGNIGIASVIGALMVTLIKVSEGQGEQLVLGIAVLITGLFALWLLAKSRWVEKQLNRVIAYTLKHFTHLEVRDYVSLLELAKGFTVSELEVEPGDWVAEKTLVDLSLAREGVLVLGIRRHDGNYIGAPSGGSKICTHDTLVIYGPFNRIEELDSRCAGHDGDQAHQAAAKEYDDYLAEVRIEDIPAAS